MRTHQKYVAAMPCERCGEDRTCCWWVPRRFIVLGGYLCFECAACGYTWRNETVEAERARRRPPGSLAARRERA